MRVLAAHSCGLVAVEKPPGIRSHPNRDGRDAQALLRLPYRQAEERYLEDEGPGWHLLHRLDAPTSGLVLLAREAALAAEVRKAFAGREVAKVYFALVRGRPAKSREVWRDRLRTVREGGGLRTSTGGGEPAEADMRLVRSKDQTPLVSLIELRPHTGRTHQLRVQCASRQLPIIGDATYGDFSLNREWARRLHTKRLFLHAESLRLRLRWQGRPLQFEAQSPLPKDFLAAF